MTLFKGQRSAPGKRLPGGAEKLNLSGNRAQQIFSEKTKLYGKAGVITTPGYLRLEINLTTNTNQINFLTTDNQGASNVTERRLKISDTFTMMNIGFYIGISPTDVTKPNISQMPLYTWPNSQAMTAIEAGQYRKIYNGYYSLKVDSTQFIDSYPMYAFYRVGQSQQGVGSSAVSNVPVQADEWPVSMFGANNFVPSVELNGTSNVQQSISLPDTMTVAIAGKVGVAVLILQGFLHQGAANNQSAINAREILSRQ